LAFSPKVAIGINSGEAVSGNIGAISLRRLDYTVVGDMVNTAQRLQSVAGEEQIVITDESYEKVKDSFTCRSLGKVKVKNKTEPLALYEVLS
jgi:class 3 adenylate cyclase